LPIGNLTSQWFANWYLTGFDHRLTSGWGVGGYVRYRDDFVLLDGSRRRLRELMAEATETLAALGLALHHERSILAPSRAGRVFVGFRIAPDTRRLRNRTVRHFVTRLGRYRRGFDRGRLSPSDIGRRLMGWLGHAGQADSAPLQSRLARNWVFRRGQFVRFRG
jgi:hypothetical protein